MLVCKSVTSLPGKEQWVVVWSLMFEYVLWLPCHDLVLQWALVCVVTWRYEFNAGSSHCFFAFTSSEMLKPFCGSGHVRLLEEGRARCNMPSYLLFTDLFWFVAIPVILYLSFSSCLCVLCFTYIVFFSPLCFSFLEWPMFIFQDFTTVSKPLYPYKIYTL